MEIKPKYLGRWVNQKKNVAIGARYQCFCPFCKKKNIIWPSEFSVEKANGTNKCKHFSCLTPKLEMKFERGFEITEKNGEVIVNGISSKYRMDDMLCLIDELEECDWLRKFLLKLHCISSTSSGFEYLNERGDHLREELVKYKSKDL